jgi:hypothetical protein
MKVTIKLELQYFCVRFEIFTAVTMKTAVFWDVTPCDSYKNGRLGGMFRANHQGEENRRARNNVGSNRQPKLCAKK